MEKIIKEFAASYQQYRGLQAESITLQKKFQQTPATDKQKKRLVDIMAKITALQKSMDPQAQLISTAFAAVDKDRRVMGKNNMPIYEAFNQYFQALFNDHPAMEVALITEATQLTGDINATFDTGFKVKQVVQQLVKMGEAVEGQGYQFKRADFYVAGQEGTVM